MILDQPLTIYTAAELKPRMIEAVGGPGFDGFDLSAVGEIDSAGVQLLLLARREAATRGAPFRLARASDCVIDALSMLGLESMLRDATVSPDEEPNP